ncbi:MAG: glycine hydroxymethyltransferase, partial [Myxococcales bacterium]|nr:glycine hydroxymethyltransferase [Myxococcales bacterium]
LKPGDKVMGLALPMGGHLTHGWNVSITGRYFASVQYGVRKDTGRIDYDEVRELAKREKPALIWAGGTAYSRLWDFPAMASIAKEVGARFAADIAHIAGLIAGGAHPTPVGHADVVTTTTHKTLRGPRGGMILTTAEHATAIDRAVFPGLQGGPHVHNTAALAVALKEAALPSFRDYAHQVVANAKVIADELVARDYQVVSGGTDNHLILVDLSNKNVPGKIAAKALDKAGIELNYNSVPYDTRKPFDPSGIRLGSPSVTSRGMRQPEMKLIAGWIDRVISDPSDDNAAKVRGEVLELTKRFPAPGISA